MIRPLTRIFPLVAVAVIAVSISIYFDRDTCHWVWFQRSGSLVALIGAVLGYRSIVRLGIEGVGATTPPAIMAKVVSIDDSGPVQMGNFAIDEHTQRLLNEAAYDKLAGFVGAFLIICGTLIWGYGDLLGLL
jgi:hypothetical protein